MRANIFLLAMFTTMTAICNQATAQEVRITKDMLQMEYSFNGKTHKITRDQNQDARIHDDYSKTSRPCPVFCVQPMEVAPGVKTVGELEVMSFLSVTVSSGNGFLLDSRSTDWYKKRTIPGAVNLPYNLFIPNPENVFFNSVMDMLGGSQNAEGEWGFEDPKDLLLFCNGPWCDQSPQAIRNLLAINYPAKNLYYYRGGMQNWVGMGLTVEIPK